MKKYSSIEGIKNLKSFYLNKDCIAFYKYDGSNLAFHYSKKQKFHKFGTRNRFFDKNDEIFGEAIEIFNKKYASKIEEIIKTNELTKKTEEFTAYCEFLGPNSFAGQHTIEQLNSLNFNVANNDPKDLVLFDINIHKKGLIGPFDFVNIFKELDIAKIIYKGKFDVELINNVKNNIYNLKEGVIVKGGNSFDHTIWMFKIKTNDYIKLLIDKFHNNYEQYA